MNLETDANPFRYGALALDDAFTDRQSEIAELKADVVNGQDVVVFDPRLPRLMRAVFQEQPEVAHVYLGSKRHMMRRLFSDENEPFWRSAKPVELGVIAPEPFAAYIVERFRATGRSIQADA